MCGGDDAGLCDVSCTDPGPVEEDEMYEQCVEEMTRVYVVQTDQLLLVPEYSGVGLKHEILNTKRVGPP